jgi:addiction module RelE/StbE family toxin
LARKLTWSQSAWDDLEESAEYISRDSPNYARVFVNEIRKTAQSLVTLSERGRIVPEFNTSEIREVFVRSYRLIYRVSINEVIIIGLVHGARDLDRIGLSD